MPLEERCRLNWLATSIVALSQVYWWWRAKERKIVIVVIAGFFFSLFSSLLFLSLFFWIPPSSRAFRSSTPVTNFSDPNRSIEIHTTAATGTIMTLEDERVADLSFIIIAINWLVD